MRDLVYVSAFDRVGYNFYQRVHRWLRNNFGKAKLCEFCNTTESKSYEWALKQDCEYDFDINNFIQLCGSCHKKYDSHPEIIKRVSIGNKRDKPWLYKPIKRIASDGQTTEYISIKAAVQVNAGILKGSIMNCLSGISKSAGGYKWEYK